MTSSRAISSGRGAPGGRPARAIPCCAALALLAACSRPPPAPPPGAAAGGVPEVGVVTLEPRAVPLTRELPGRTSAYRVAEIRARVNGIVQKRLFTEGADVKAGEVLYRIDPAPYQARLASARAQLARAEASVASARLQATRYAELVEANAVSRQEYDNAVASEKALVADVAAGRAAVDTATIDLGYTTVTAPVSGRIGRSAVTEGAYVQAGPATLLATIQQLDPVYVDVTQSSSELLRLRRELDGGHLQRAGQGARATLVLEDGTAYGLPGTLQFSDVTVDPSTGSVTLRALFPNPKAELLPGMFVRARLEEAVNPQALLVPQRALTRDAKGQARVLVVGADGKVEARAIEAPRTVGDSWLVQAGLRPGEQVIVDGLQKARPGATVKAVPAAAPAPSPPAESPPGAPPGPRAQGASAERDQARR